MSSESDGFTDSAVEEKPPGLKRPEKYAVYLHNDDYTTMDFVVEVLRKFFNKNETQATEIMLLIHQKGRAICGLFPFEVAETKVFQVTEYAKTSGFPLKCTLEPE